MTTIPQITKDCRTAMEKSFEASKRELASIRTGKATASLLDTVRVEAYGQQMPLNQVAGVSAPEPRLLTVTPWDKGLVTAIEKALRESDLGLNPQTQSGVIRVPLPSLNEQRRKELVKVVHKLAEEASCSEWPVKPARCRWSRRESRWPPSCLSRFTRNDWAFTRSLSPLSSRWFCYCSRARSGSGDRRASLYHPSRSRRSE
jgi:ribosome recycling factor